MPELETLAKMTGSSDRLIADVTRYSDDTIRSFITIGTDSGNGPESIPLRAALAVIAEAAAEDEEVRRMVRQSGLMSVLAEEA